MRKLNLTGKTFNRLTVIKEVPSPEKDSHWLCQCACGNTAVIRGNAIKDGRTRSCGCLARESAKAVAQKNDIKTLAHKGYNDKRINGVATFLINDRPQKNTRSGYKGVLEYKLKDGSPRYQAYLTVNKKTYSKKGFETAAEAYQYRLALIKKYVPKEQQNEI